MRISFTTEKDASLLWINQRKEDIANLTNSISSQKKMATPSDDPISWARAMDFKHGLGEYDSILGNMDFATGWDQATDSALGNVGELVSQARQCAISANSASGPEQRDALVSQLDGIIKNMISAANTQYGDQYVFAGSKYSATPYSIDDATGTVTYAGDDEAVKVRTSREPVATGAFTVNLTGNQAFTFTSGASTLNVINEVWKLKDAIRTGNSTNITTQLGTLIQASDAISKQSSIIGSRLSSVEQQKSAITLIKTNTQSNLSDVDDVDLPDAITKLQQHTAAFEAALKVTGLTANLNLASYLS